MTDEKPVTNGFAQRALLVLLAVLTPTLLAYFVWLGTAVLHIQQDIGTIRDNVKSLIDTRTAQATEASARNARHIEELEKVDEARPAVAAGSGK